MKLIEKTMDEVELINSFEKKLVKELTELNKISLAHLEEEFANYKELFPHDRDKK